MVPLLEHDQYFLKLVQQGYLSVCTQGVVTNTQTGNRIGTKATGYWKVSHRDKEQGGRVRNIAVHRLVWLVYNGEIPQGILVNHKNGNKLDCSLENLELATYSENGKHAFATGLNKIQPRLSKRRVKNIIAKGNEESLEELAKKYKVKPATIKNILTGKSHKEIPRPEVSPAQTAAS